MQINGGFFEIFLEILDDLDRCTILECREKHSITAKANSIEGNSKSGSGGKHATKMQDITARFFSPQGTKGKAA